MSDQLGEGTDEALRLFDALVASAEARERRRCIAALEALLPGTVDRDYDTLQVAIDALKSNASSSVPSVGGGT